MPPHRYRLAPAHTFPVAFEDVYRAVKHFLQQGVLDQYSVDPERVAVSGDSAGGNLAAAVSQQVLPFRALIRSWAMLSAAPLPRGQVCLLVSLSLGPSWFHLRPLPDAVSSFRASQQRWMVNCFFGSLAKSYTS